MGMNVQVIKKNGEKEFAILPYNEFMRMQQILEDYEDLVDLRKAKAETVNEPSVTFKKVAENIRIKKGRGNSSRQ